MDFVSQSLLMVAGSGDPGSNWIATLGGASSDFGRGVAVDSAANVYIVGETNSAGAGADDTFLAKYSSAGVIQWQRTLGGASSDFSWGVAVDSAANVYIVGSIGADSLLAKLPSDGTGEGTYGGLTYQASNLTASTSTLTASTSNLTSSLSSLTSSLSNLTSSISNLTSTTTPI